MGVNAPPQVTPDPGFIEQLLIELGAARTRLEAYEEADRQRKAEQDTKDEADRLLNELALKKVCRLRWVMQPQGRYLIGNRVYTGRGPQRNRTTRQIIKHGTEFWAPADDARVLQESGYAEILEGREHVVKWTPQLTQRAGPLEADAPAAGDAEGWAARQVWD